MNHKTATIISRKFNNVVHRSWKARLIGQEGNLINFVGEFENTVNHKQLGIIGRGTVSYEFYWLDRWYNVFRFHEHDGAFRNFYANINLPPKFDNDVLDYVDLDIDLMIFGDLSYQILDLDEFEENIKLFSYPKDLQENVGKSLKELIFMVENRVFPFNYEF